MECVMIDQSGHGMEQPAAVFSKTIDGKPFIVRIFFPTANAETMQQKVERMLRHDILNAVRKSNA